ncbi:MAG: glycerophosphodiester phosphodiesterase [Pyrinomonadaceae bacterium]
MCASRTGGRGRVILFAASAAAGLALLLAAGLYLAVSPAAGEAVAGHPYFSRDAPGRPLVIAHRGGAGLWPENTLHAFGRAAALGVDVIETDVRSPADGEMVVIHDETVGRTTDGEGRVRQLTLAELKRLDAAHRWSPDGGRSFPLRGRGITVPTLREVFEALPGARFNIEPKQSEPPIVAPLCRLIREHGMATRVLVAAFAGDTMERFRRECPEVATSASTAEAAGFLALQRSGFAGSYGPPMQALQVPERAGALNVLSREFVAAAHARNLRVHAWTVNSEGDMRRLLDLGVDGIMTDYPDRLLKLLKRPADLPPAP